MAPSPTPPDQLTICTVHCGARCCTYVTVAVPAPRARPDWDEMRWWLAHEGTLVTRDDDGWMLHVRTPCRHLAADRTCGIYAHRMNACASYDPAACEYANPVPFDLELRTEADLAEHLERRGLVRGAAVAAAIRRGEAARPPARRPGARAVGASGLNGRR